MRGDEEERTRGAYAPRRRRAGKCVRALKHPKASAAQHTAFPDIRRHIFWRRGHLEVWTLSLGPGSRGESFSDSPGAR